ASTAPADQWPNDTPVPSATVDRVRARTPRGRSRPRSPPPRVARRRSPGSGFRSRRSPRLPACRRTASRARGAESRATRRRPAAGRDRPPPARPPPRSALSSQPRPSLTMIHRRASLGGASAPRQPAARTSKRPTKPKKAGRAHFFRNLARVGSGGKARAHSSRRRTTAPPAEIPGLRVARLLVGALHSGVVDQAGDRLAVADVGLEDLLQVRLLDAAVPDVVGVHDDHRAVATLGEAAGLVDADLGFAAGLHGLVAQVLHELLDVALGRARIAGGADEDMCFVLPHHWASTAAI